MPAPKNISLAASLLLLLCSACGKDEAILSYEGDGAVPIPSVPPAPVGAPSAAPSASTPAPGATAPAPTTTPAEPTAAPEPASPVEPTPIQTPGVETPGEEPAASQDLSLFGAPLIFNPTSTGFSINAVFVYPDERELRAYVSVSGTQAWGEVTESSYPALDAIEWSVRGLEPATTYDYAIMAVPPGAEGMAVDVSPPPPLPADGGSPPSDGGFQPLPGEGGSPAMSMDSSAPSSDGTAVMSEGGVTPPPDANQLPVDATEAPIGLPGTLMYRGTVTTQRPPGQSYRFALITDTHIAPREVSAGSLETIDTVEQTLLDVAGAMRAEQPDFLVNLGDMLDFHLFGFNAPPPDGSWTRLAYLNYRRLLNDALGNAPHFPVIGNWDGENGDFTEEQITYSREQRLRYLPAPEPDTYPLGGNVDEDYYAFTWGDATFITLNVMTYTPTSHLLGTFPGVSDDWTLGEEQLQWFVETLEQVDTKWRFILIHHAVGGAAGDEINSAYGRGGGQAARVGEQSLVHDLMLEYGVQVFFYGHDHVFTDIVVDGIHYTLPGSAGAPWKFSTAETGYEQYWPDSGWALVEVSPERVGVEFISVTGDVLYSYELEE